MYHIMETLITVQYPDGTWKWTLTSILGDSLAKAESQFGQRDKDYTILGIEFVDQPQPCIWYSSSSRLGKHIIIRLMINCVEDFNQGVFQLTHEVIHCLSPIGPAIAATVLEEGLASYFSQEYSKNHGNLVNSGNYLEARNLVEELLAIDIDIIKKLREIQPTISLITEAEILSVNDSVPQRLARDLTQLFQ